MKIESNLSEALIRDKPQKRYSLIIKDGSVTASKLSSTAITEIASKVAGEVSVVAMDDADIDAIMGDNIAVETAMHKETNKTSENKGTDRNDRKIKMIND